jgi:hypothetical protein
MVGLGLVSPVDHWMSDGAFTYSPSCQQASPAAIVKELATLMTAGRLNSDRRNVFQEVYSTELDSNVAWGHKGTSAHCS